jgi:LPXTG-site transpeptidase (sortase) family protein
MKTIFTSHWRVWLAGSVAANVIAVALLAFAFLPRETPSTRTSDVYRDLFEHRLTRADVRGEVAPPPVASGAVTQALATFSPATRMRIPRIGVDADLVVLGILPNGHMDDPSGPKEVGIYNFASKPGLGGNSVFSGHVDYHDYGPAVFWNLKKLVAGDAIEVVLKDGTVVQYSVTATHLYPVAELPMAEVVGPTATESATLITCGGTFRNGEYSDRLIVRAVKTGTVKAGS